MSNDPPDLDVVATGVAGLDDILRGGLTQDRLYLIEGDPGSGKTTLGLQFLLAGVGRGEPTLYVTLSETKRELESIARSHGWSVEGIHVVEMAPEESSLSPEAELTMFHPSEFELNETTKAVLAEVERVRPTRVVFDSLSELRLLSQDPLRYRRQILGLKHFFAGRGVTVLLLDDRTAPGEDLQLQSIAHGVIRLEQLVTDYGAERRRLRVYKMRGVAFRGGHHDFIIRRGGLDVFPRLVASEHHLPYSSASMSSGNAGLDRLLGGGFPSGSSTLFVGPAGSGKSTIALLSALAAAERGERAALFIFDETIGTLRARAASLRLPLAEAMEAGLVTVQQVDPAELSPGEFIATLRQAVAGTDGHPPAKLVQIDSLNGYLHSMPEERYLTAQLHEMLTYLNQQGVSSMLTVTQSGMVGSQMRSPVDTTYLADNVILFRYFEARGEIRRAISVIKKRSGPHELTIRELRMSDGGIEIGEPLVDFEGVLTGTPRFVGKSTDLMAGRADEGA